MTTHNGQPRTIYHKHLACVIIENLDNAIATYGTIEITLGVAAIPIGVHYSGADRLLAAANGPRFDPNNP